MARVDAYTNLNLINPNVGYGYTDYASSTEIVITDGYREAVYVGRGFSYSGPYVVSGVLDAYYEYQGGALAGQITEIYIPATLAQSYISNNDLRGLFEVVLSGNDIIYGSASADAIAGYAGNDFISAGNGNDLIYGGSGNDIIYAGDGVDDVYGGSGLDFVEFEGSSLDFIAQRSGSGIEIRSYDGFADTLVFETERLGFTDGVIALDVGAGETAGQAYRLYQAAFDRTPDTAGVGFWVDRMDDGQSLISVANQFIGSNEFRLIYGSNPTIHDFVSRLYQNVLGREGEAGGQAYWEDQLASGARSAADVLANFSESAENVANVAPVIQDGFWYTGA